MKANKTLDAFEHYCRDGNVQFALGSIAGNESELKIATALLYDCFIAGAQYATRRCNDEHGTPVVWIRDDDLQKATESAYLCRLVGNRWHKEGKGYLPLYLKDKHGSAP